MSNWFGRLDLNVTVRAVRIGVQGHRIAVLKGKFLSREILDGVSYRWQALLASTSKEMYVTFEARIGLVD